MSPSSSGRRGRSPGPPRRYPRLARVNETLREVLAEALARIGDTDDRLTMVTVTAVDCDADFRTATVLLSSLTPAEEEALGEARIKLQAAVSREVRLKRTPLLRFTADPAVAAGQRIEDILRTISTAEPGATESTAEPEATKRVAEPEATEGAADGGDPPGGGG